MTTEPATPQSARDQALAYYSAKYDQVGCWLIKPGTKVTLGTKENRVCRFCGKREPEVSFKKEAHAIPELLGNKSITALYECDTCNEFFGETIENDFGKWSKPMRSMARIRGKSGVPTLKRGGTTGWRVESDGSGFEIKAYEDDPFFELDEQARTIRFRFKREPYTPVAVLKTFVKMGLTLMPEEEIGNFKNTLQWLLCPDHKRTIAREFPIFYAFQPGPMPNDLIAAIVLRRKASVDDVPYAFFVLGYGNEVYQVALPAFHKDSSIMGKPLNFTLYPTPGSPMPERFPQVGRTVLDLTGTEVVKDQEWPITMGFDAIVGGPAGGKTAE